MMVAPENTIVIVPHTKEFKDSYKSVVQSFKGNIKRDWFIKRAYWCLPLTIGNQYGFGIKSLKTFTVEWNGGVLPKDVTVTILEDAEVPDEQTITAHFGMGTVTIDNKFSFRTPPGVNLMTINPPNYWIDGIQHMTGVIETDNLRRDFTFNLKVTRPNHKITINKGDFIGCVIPIPRYFVDSFDLKEAEELFTEFQVLEEQKAFKDFAIERFGYDKHKPHWNGRRYFDGEDVYGTPFPDHQKKIR